jgi:hypothetical protein
MTQPKPESGWENPDHHPDSKKARPMFGPDGKPVDKLPEPEPLTQAELAMFAAMEAGASQAQAVATGVIVGEQDLATGGIIRGSLASIMSGTKINAGMMTPIGKATRIRELATKALDNPSPASWAVALAEIVRELDA